MGDAFVVLAVGAIVGGAWNRISQSHALKTANS